MDACLPAPQALAPPHRPQQPPGTTALLCTPASGPTRGRGPFAPFPWAPASGPTRGRGALCPLPSGTSCAPHSWTWPLSSGGWGGGAGGVPVSAYLTTANGQLPLVTEADPHPQGPCLPPWPFGVPSKPQAGCRDSWMSWDLRIANAGKPTGLGANKHEPLHILR